MQIILAPTYELALKAKKGYDPEITVEAEYGDNVVDGSLYTAAHHGSRSMNPAPCIDENLDNLFLHSSGNILISHIDLDTIGGIIRTIKKPENSDLCFWATAAEVDVFGIHRMQQRPDVERQIWAWQAYFQHNSKRYPVDSVTDVTNDVTEAIKIIKKIINNDEILIDEGERYKNELILLDKSTLIEKQGRLLVRVSPVFANSLYHHDSDIIVCYNEKFQSVTLSIASTDDNFNCVDIMQEFFGTDSGGRNTIAGSPRGKIVTKEQFFEFVKFLKLKLNRKEN